MSAVVPEDCDKWPWLHAVASPYGPRDPSTRLVLFALGLYMNSKGENCFPSQHTLALHTGLSERTVRKALASAAAGGWITREKRGNKKNPQGWALQQYFATVPAGIATRAHKWQDDPQWRREETTSAPRRETTSARSTRETLRETSRAARGAATDAEGTETDAGHTAIDDMTCGNLRPNVRKPLPPIYSGIYPENFPMTQSGESGLTPTGPRALRLAIVKTEKKPLDHQATAVLHDLVEGGAGLAEARRVLHAYNISDADIVAVRRSGGSHA